MATVNVSTWTELVNAIKATYPSDDYNIVINITADIDCNDDIPLGVSSVIENNFSSYRDITINGAYTENGVTKNHVIRNLRSHVLNPTYIFRYVLYNSTMTWNNVDFINLVLRYALFISGNTGSLTMNNCRFVGRRQSYLFQSGGEYNRSTVTLNSCFFNAQFIPSNGVNTSLYPLTDNTYLSVYANFCWFHEVYKGWHLNDFDSSSYINLSDFWRIYLTGCYVDGEIVSAGVGRIYVSEPSNYSNYDATIQNVIDVKFRIKNPIPSESVKIACPKGVYKTLFVDYDDETVVLDSSNFTLINSSYAIPESPTDMTNPAKLYADGFDVIVPE